MNRHVAVIDIGKTNAKLALVDLGTLGEIAVVTRPNTVLPGPPYPHFDVGGHWDFLMDALTRFNAEHVIDAISITTHGASGALIGHDGALATPILDYEHTGPDEAAAEYDAIRPPFSETGSPRLPVGLNLGAQLHWLLQTVPELAERTAHVVTYPQYWGFRLTGVAATDMTSLGCHTDLWNPTKRRFSSLPTRLGIVEKFAPPLASGDVLGPILPDVASATGLAPDTPVYCGIHDSNASLLPHLLSQSPPFSVVSTGTWAIAMAIGGSPVTLDPAQDTLINVNAFGDPVPSARFMGGREHDLAMGGDSPQPTEDDIRNALASGAMLLPALVPDTGPFQGQTARWVGAEPPGGTPARAVAVALYLALVTTRCLDLIGRQGPTIIEGPFARNSPYCRMLSVLTRAEVLAMNGITGTSQGAALLAGQATTKPRDGVRRFSPLDPQSDQMWDYERTWAAALP